MAITEEYLNGIKKGLPDLYEWVGELSSGKIVQGTDEQIRMLKDVIATYEAILAKHKA